MGPGLRVVSIFPIIGKAEVSISAGGLGLTCPGSPWAHSSHRRSVQNGSQGGPHPGSCSGGPQGDLKGL